MRVLSFDPGPDHGTTGYAYQDENELLEMEDANGPGKTIIDFLRDWDLKDKPVDVVVVEGYINMPGGKNPYYRPLKTSENIGKIKGWAEMNRIRIHEYFPKDKPTECKATQVFPKKVPKAIEHRLDAYNHGRYYLIKQGLALTALEMKVLKG